ncbi:hypothetical protein PYCCODRAFT_1386882 [Trametes coccinea BRFM310]|uniref:non-specific serine/threonine protein kinase n=1 Tax=Trametes coccinea (strain BRFM310) TaxID=1353009 RepID=A0A1Y2IU83_TRAC3|nr:hypothetical protein PYCCODRAFT_1386882 [Trametes coccinea BRFM310]
MLGTRTKHVFAYGRRGHRVVTVSDDIEGRKARDAAPVDVRRENAVPVSAKAVEQSPVLLKTSTVRKAGQRANKNKTSPKVLKLGATKSPKSKRLPLGSIMPNAPGSPAVPPQLKAKRRQTVARPSPLVPSSPIVDVDIVVLDAQGRRVSQERRISRSNVPANVLAVPSPPQIKPAARGKAVARHQAIVLSSDSEEDLPEARPKRRTRGRLANPIIISDEESSQSDYEPSPRASSSNADASFERTPLPRVKRGHQRARPKVVLSPSPTPSLSPSPSPPTTPPPQPRKPARLVPVVEVPLARSCTLPSQPIRPPPLAPFSSVPQIEEAGPSRSKPRRLTPIRARQGRTIFPSPPSPPSPTTPTDLDLTFDFAQLALSPNALAEVQQLEEAIPPPPAYVRPLLEECSQTSPHEFSAFIEMFPFDPIVRETSHGTSATMGTGPPRFLKIGEASFSEVFGIGGVVLKIVPLRDEERAAAADYAEVEGPAPSDAKDVLKEIIVTRAMGATCPGFVELLRTYIVRGKYPSLLLDLWDEYDERKGSEGVRPDTFSVSQLYAIIVLPNGGPDLEAYTFSTPTKTGWRQACSVFWQVARALSEAEEVVSFEHRDLHWGQILVKNIPAKTSGRRKTRVSMDDVDHGVLVTIIDLGLARMDAHDGNGHHIHWTPFDEETFEGEGDYQFDIYRMMRTHNGDSWEDFKPLTNVMWLHYLALKLLNAKRLRAPAASRKSSAPASSAGFTERDCYECLKEVEALLGQCLAGVKAPQTVRKGRRKTQAPSKAAKIEVAGPKSASELVEMAIERGWVVA